MVSEITIEGFERLLKMIEERFGKFGRAIGIILLILAGIALAGFLMNVIFQNILVPAKTLADLLENEPRNIISIIFRLLILATNIAAFAVVFFWWIPGYFRYRREKKALDKKIEQLDRDTALSKQQLRAVQSFSAAYKANISAVNKQLAKKGDKIDRKIIEKFMMDLSRAAGITEKKLDELDEAKSPQLQFRRVLKPPRKQAKRSRGKSRA